MKKFICSSLIALLVYSCSHADFKKDGGIEVTVEASVGDLLKAYIKSDDSIARAIINETYKEYYHQEKPFLEFYFSKLETADPKNNMGTHFKGFGLNTTASVSECKTYFEKKLAESMDTIKMILEKRVDAFGISGSNIRRGTLAEQLIIELPGKPEMERVRRLLQSSAKLEFWETYDNKDMYQLMTDLNASLSKELFPDFKKDTAANATKLESKTGTLNEQFGEQKKAEEKKQEYIVKSNPLFSILLPAIKYDESGRPVDLSPGPVVGRASYKDTAKVNSYLNLPSSKKIMGRYIKFLWAYKADNEQGVYSLIAIKVKRDGLAPLSGNIIKSARKVFDRPGGGAPQISVTMTQQAGWDWKKLTHDNVGKCIAITIDDRVFSFPTVMSEIKGGISSITGNFTNVEAADFVNVLQAGYFPMRVHIVAEQVVPPLGAR